MTKNRRYEAHYDAMNDARIAEAEQRHTPVTLPPAAWGPREVTWVDRPVPVWAWLQYGAMPARRVECLAHGWNDRIVVVSWESGALGRTVIVWRQAVAHRSARAH